MVAGVCAGLGEHFDVDPVLFRVAFVVLALLGGAGILLYVLLWILLPPDDGSAVPGSPIAQRASTRSRATGTWLGIAILVAGGILLIGDLGAHRPFPWAIRPGIVWGIALVLLGILLYQRGERRKEQAGPSTTGSIPPPPAPAPAAFPAPEISPTAGVEGSPDPLGVADMESTAPAATLETAPSTATDVAPSPYPSPWYTSPPSPPAEPVAVASAERPARRRARSALGWMTLGVALLAVGLAALLDQWTSIDMTVGRYLALVLLVLGGGLIVGAWLGRARWLIVLAILLLPFVLAASLISVPLTGGTGDHSFVPASVGEIQPTYRLAAGQLRIDLSNTDLGGQSVPIVATVGVGRLVVVVPNDVTVVINAKMGAGLIEVSSDPFSPLDRQVDGVNVRLDQTYASTSAAGAVTLDLGAGYGVINVYRTNPPSLG